MFTNNNKINSFVCLYLTYFLFHVGLLLLTFVRVRGLQCGTYVNFEGLPRVAIQGLTWVNFWNLVETRVKFRFLVYPVNPGQPAWLTVQRRGTLPVAPAQATRVSAGELG